jgi:hypothetical protein
MLPCSKANILGEPGKGIHSLQIGGVALVDLLLTLGAALGLSYIPGSPPFTVWIILLLLLAIVVHAGFCTKTSVNKWLYSSQANVWIVVSIILVLITLIVVFGHLNGSLR